MSHYRGCKKGGDARCTVLPNLDSSSQGDHALHLAHTAPVAFSVNSRLVWDSVLLLSEQLNIEVMAKLLNLWIGKVNLVTKLHPLMKAV